MPARFADKDIHARLASTPESRRQNLSAVSRVVIGAGERGVVVDVVQIAEGQRDFLSAGGFASNNAHGGGRKRLRKLDIAEQFFELRDGLNAHHAGTDFRADPKSFRVP